MARRLTLTEVYARDRRNRERDYEESQKQQRARDRKQARLEREDAAQYKHQQKANADTETHGIRKLVEELRTLHVRFVRDCAPLDFGAILSKQRPTTFVAAEVDHLSTLPARYYDQRSASHPEDHRIFECKLEEYLRYVQPASFWERLTGSRRYKKELAEARDLYLRRRNEVRSENELAWQKFNQELQQKHAEHEAKKQEKRAFIKKVRDGYANGDKWGVARYFEQKLKGVRLPKACKVDYHITFTPKDRRANALVWIPDASIVPQNTAVRYVAQHNEFRETKRTDGDIWRIYQSTAAGIAVGVVHCIFRSDGAGHIDIVSIRVSKPGCDPQTGESTREALLSLKISRAEWARLDPANVDPIECLRGLGATFEERWKSR